MPQGIDHRLALRGVQTVCANRELQDGTRVVSSHSGDSVVFGRVVVLPPGRHRNRSQPRGHSESGGRVVELPLDDARQLAVCLWPAGAVHCSIADLARYTVDHLNGLQGRRTLLPQALYQRLHRPLDGSNDGFTLGWGVRPDNQWGMTHFGAGSGGWFFARIEIVPKYDAAVVAASNSGLAAHATQELITELLGKFAARK